MKIDFHTHCFPDFLANRAVESLSRASGGLVPETDGTVGGLLKSMQRANVDFSVVMNIATNPKQQTAVNDFAADVNKNDKLFAFGSVHPEAANALEELERIKMLGLKGVKFHPEYQRFYAGDEKMRPIYRKISELGLIVLFHSGADIGFMPPYHCTADELIGALKYLDCPVVAAHWGGMFQFEAVIEKLCGLPLYFDTSYGYSAIPAPVARAIVSKHGAEKILFGSDTPWHTPLCEERFLEGIGISESEKEQIYSKNARKLLGI